ncbi:MAG: prepilin peptidase [bacterium]
MTSYRITDFSSSFSSMLGGLCFIGLLMIAAASDVRARRIPNALVLVLAVLGLAYSAFTLPVLIGASRAALGLGLGFSLWIPFYALGMIGAGDVKLFAAGCCWLAPSQVIVAALLSAFAGGVLSIIALVLAHGAGITVFRIAQVARDPTALATPLNTPEGRPTLPYGLALVVGLGVAGWVPLVSKLA